MEMKNMCVDLLCGICKDVDMEWNIFVEKLEFCKVKKLENCVNVA